MHRSRDERVVALDTERAGTLEAGAGMAGRDAGDAREVAVEVAVDDREAAATQTLERQLGRNPGRQADDLLDRRLGGGLDRHGSAHREAE